jgi:hypothetical protein
MMKRIVALGLVLACVGTACAGDTILFKIITRRPDDRVDVKSEPSQVVVLVSSPSGIGTATIERTSPHWPDKITVQLRLKGLESLKVSSEQVRLEASVSSSSGESRVWIGAKEESTLDSHSPYWMEIRLRDSKGQTTRNIPILDGYIEIPLPKPFFASNPKVFSLSWVDFYRS